MVAVSASDALQRVSELVQQNADIEPVKLRIRNIMDGGADGIRAVIAWNQGNAGEGRKQPLGDDLPAVNMMVSGVERLGQQVGLAPSLRMPTGVDLNDDVREDAETREHIVEGWDESSVTELQFPQIGRWLPGYGDFSWLIRPRREPVTGQLFPHMELRDPFDTMVGWLGAAQQPYDLVYRRVVPLGALERIYPRDDWEVLEKRIAQGGREAVAYGTVRERGWEGKRNGVAVFEYVCDYGTYICIPEADVVVDYQPNICDTGPAFIYGKRISFNRLVSQYQHAIGLVAMMAKLNVLSLINAEDSTFAPWMIFGEMDGNELERGRNGVNRFASNARVERGPTDAQGLQVVMAQLQSVERQLRIQSGYDAGSDSIAARGGWVTGEGQRELATPVDRNVKEYRTIIRIALEQADTRRLEMAQKLWAGEKRRVFAIQGGRLVVQEVDLGKAIDDTWRTRRVYGMMAGWDDNQKIVAGLQLLQGEVIDVDEFQNNLDGLDDPRQINLRIRRRKAERSLMILLEQQAGQGNPTASAALVEVMKRPHEMETILTKFYLPETPEPSPEELAMMEGQLPGGAVPAGGPPKGLGGNTPTVQTILSRLTGGGQAEGGVQTVGTMVRR